MDTTLAALFADIRRGAHTTMAVEACVSQALRYQGARAPDGSYPGALFLAAALRLRPTLLDGFPRRDHRRARDARRLFALIGRQLGAASTGDARAAAWLHALVPPRPTRRRKNVSQQGSPCPIEDWEFVIGYNAMMRYVYGVHDAAWRLPRTTTRAA